MEMGYCCWWEVELDKIYRVLKFVSVRNDKLFRMKNDSKRFRINMFR